MPARPARGELKFALVGSKLAGTWALVRLKDKGPRTNWLLVKHRGDGAYARKLSADALDRSAASGRTMGAIAAGRQPQPKPFMTVPSSSATDGSTPERGKRLPAFVRPQLCELVQSPPDGEGWLHEVKIDGYRIQVAVARGVATVRSRSGHDWTEKISGLAAAAARLPDCILDGELTVLDARGVSDFPALLDALTRADHDRLTYFAFDLLFLGGKDLRNVPLWQRKQRLQAMLGGGDRPVDGGIRFLQHVEGRGSDILASACAMNLEGIVSKKAAAPYRSGRGGAWTKAKCRPRQEVIIGGWSERAGQLRSLLVGVGQGQTLHYAGRVGTGFNRGNSAELIAALRRQRSTRSPFVDAPKTTSDIRWVKPVLVAEIEFAGWTAAGSVRQAAFKGLREDKPAGSVQREREVAGGASKPATASRSATCKTHAPARHGAPAPSAMPNRVGGIAISNPDKPLWPATEGSPAVTKLMLASYLEAVGPKLLAHIAGRPCSIVRAPDGIGGETFFQRHTGDTLGRHLSAVRVSGDRQPYIQIDRLDQLITLAQLGVVELHPWNCAPDAPDVPGRLVFDLDPGEGVAWAT